MSVTILIADDEERWRRIVGDFLRNEGYRVLEAADGQQVMELMRSEEKIDLVVLDIMMPPDPQNVRRPGDDRHRAGRRGRRAGRLSLRGG